jgi:hypothetical protein
MPLHQVNERGVLFSSGTVGFKDYALASIGTTRYFRAVSFNALVDDADETLTRSLGAATIKPFSPAHLKGSRIGTTDLTITWQLRSRAIVRAFSIVQAPVLEPFERYQIEIRNTAGGTVLRTIEVDEARTVTYTTAQQTADGVTPGATVHVTIYQISDVIGRGNKTEAYL